LADEVTKYERLNISQFFVPTRNERFIATQDHSQVLRPYTRHFNSC